MAEKSFECRQGSSFLSNPSRDGAKAVVSSYFGAGTGTQVLGYMNCQGNEHHLLQCPMSYTLNKQHWNYHGDDAGVICPPCTYLRDLRRYFNHHKNLKQNEC